MIITDVNNVKPIDSFVLLFFVMLIYVDLPENVLFHFTKHDLSFTFTLVDKWGL